MKSYCISKKAALEENPWNYWQPFFKKCWITAVVDGKNIVFGEKKSTDDLKSKKTEQLLGIP